LLDVLAMSPKASVVSSLRGCSGAPGLWLFCFPPLRTSHSAHSRYPLPPIGPFVSFGPRIKKLRPSLNETQIRLGFARDRRRRRRRPLELDLFSGFALRVIDPGLHVVFRFVRDRADFFARRHNAFLQRSDMEGPLLSLRIVDMTLLRVDLQSTTE
jgi:hypothetical protein